MPGTNFHHAQLKILAKRALIEIINGINSQRGGLELLNDLYLRLINANAIGIASKKYRVSISSGNK